MVKNIAPIKGRALEYIDYQGITKEDFYKKIGMSGSTFRGKAGKSELNGEKIAIIFAEYPNVNPYWLILGKGDMQKYSQNIDKVSEDRSEYRKPTIEQELIQALKTINSQQLRIHELEKENMSLKAKLSDAGSREAI